MCAFISGEEGLVEWVNPGNYPCCAANTITSITTVASIEVTNIDLSQGEPMNLLLTTV